jgi:hypothetical protein
MPDHPWIPGLPINSAYLRTRVMPRSIVPATVDIDNNGSARLTFRLGDLRPREHGELDAFSLIVAVPAGGTITASWQATSTGVGGPLWSTPPAHPNPTSSTTCWNAWGELDVRSAAPRGDGRRRRDACPGSAAPEREISGPSESGVRACGVRLGPDVEAAPDGDQLTFGGNEVRARPRYFGAAEVNRALPQVSRREVQPVGQPLAVGRRLLQLIERHPARLPPHLRASLRNLAGADLRTCREPSGCSAPPRRCRPVMWAAAAALVPHSLWWWSRPGRSWIGRSVRPR